METKQEAKTTKPKQASVSTVPIRVKRETKKRLLGELAKVNRKDFGRKVRFDELIATALSLVTEQHIKQLQDGSLSNMDRFEMQYREHVKKHGATTKDEFLGRFLAAEISENA